MLLGWVACRRRRGVGMGMGEWMMLQWFNMPTRSTATACHPASATIAAVDMIPPSEDVQL
jgi:hypothetical protein